MRDRAPNATWFVAVALSAALVACSSKEDSGAAKTAKPPADAGAPKVAVREPVDAAPPKPEPPPGPPKRLFAKKLVSKVRTAPSKDAFRLGYLRGGAVVQAKTDKPIGYESCRKGWYELADGSGFICSTVDVIAFDGERLPERQPRQPDLTARMPYPYGYSRRAGTPVYSRIPSKEDLAALARPRTQDGGLAPVDGGVPDGGVPTLASLQGQEGSVLARRMERGFYVSLDDELRRKGRRYWRTMASNYVPYNRLLQVKGSTFVGVDLRSGELKLPIGFLLSSKYPAYRLNKRGKLRRDSKPGYHHVFAVADEVEIGGKRYYVDPEGLHYRVGHCRHIAVAERPKKVAEGDKWIDVDLSQQSLVAYEGDTPVYATLISSGKVSPDPDADFATPTGTFRIRSKHLTATMDGDHAVDGPYSIEDVPYVMYFQLAYAFHSAFWHNTFGRPRSHGCINLAPEDARWLFNWSTPQLPTGWHGVYPEEEKDGTFLRIRGETPTR